MKARTHARTTWLVVLCALGSPLACEEACHPDPPPEPELCDFDRTRDAGTVETREVVAGNMSGRGFTPYMDGGIANVVGGFQGGFMITPTVRVEAGTTPDEEVCVLVRLANELESGGAVVTGLDRVVVFRREGEFLYSDPLNDLLSMERGRVVGEVLLLDVSVEGPGFSGTDSVRLRLN